MSNRLGPVLLHLRHASSELVDELQRLDLLVWESAGTLPLDPNRPPVVVISDSELPPSVVEVVDESIRHGRTTLLHVGHWKQRGVIEWPSPDVTLPLSVSQRELIQSVRLLAEIATLRQANQTADDERNRWHELALVDELTKLPNRRNWQAELTRRSESLEGFCIGIVDLDFFKRINDRSGHDVGDSVLKETARIMKSELRQSDFLARLGGDEFGILLGPMNRELAGRILDRIRDRVATRLQLAGLPSTTMSAGCVVIQPGQRIECDDAYAVAAKSLQTAKQLQRNVTVARETTT